MSRDCEGKEEELVVLGKNYPLLQVQQDDKEEDEEEEEDGDGDEEEMKKKKKGVGGRSLELARSWKSNMPYCESSHSHPHPHASPCNVESGGGSPRVEHRASSSHPKMYYYYCPDKLGAPKLGDVGAKAFSSVRASFLWRHVQYEGEKKLVHSNKMEEGNMKIKSNLNNNTNNCANTSTKQGGLGKRKVLVYLPSNKIVTSYTDLEEKLKVVGWERYPKEDPNLLQFHKGDTSALLISLPKEFCKFRSMHMYDIVLKNRNHFRVQDICL